MLSRNQIKIFPGLRPVTAKIKKCNGIILYKCFCAMIHISIRAYYVKHARIRVICGRYFPVSDRIVMSC